LVLVLASGILVAGCRRPAADEGQLKMALVLNGPISDGGWNANAYAGLKLAEETYGFEIAYSESVQQSDYETAFTDYANQGYDLIIANGFEFTDAVMTVAENFPEVMFGIINGGAIAENVAILGFDNVEAGYLAGAFAGLMTETGYVGFVGGQEVPSITDAQAGMEMGLAATNPEAELISVMAGSWDDVAKGKEIALSMITASNVDVIFPFASAVNTGVIQGAKEKQAYVIGEPNDQLALAPGTIIGSVLQSTPDLILLAAGKVVDGTFEGEVISGNLANGVQNMGTYGDEVPEDVRTRMSEIMEQIKSGEISLR